MSSDNMESYRQWMPLESYLITMATVANIVTITGTKPEVLNDFPMAFCSVKINTSHVNKV